MMHIFGWMTTICHIGLWTQRGADAMDMEKSASRFKFFDTARNFGCIFFVKMENWHIKNENFY